MKRLLLLFVLLLAVPAALAQSNGSVLLTEDGVVYTATAEFAHEHPEIDAEATTYLVLTIREDDKPVRRIPVPATLDYGVNSQPALAFDNDNGTLYVFWQYSENAMSSELRFASFDKNGNWSIPSSFETASYHLRRNLRIALTHFATEDANGTYNRVRETNVHATWWESSAAGEEGRYAMLTLRANGETSVQVRDLTEFVKGPGKRYAVATDFNADVLRQPAMFESSEGDTVDIVFGDLQTNAMHRITVKPIGNARIRVPVGVQDKGFGPPASFNANATGRIEAISPHPDRLLFFFEEDGVMRYIAWRNESWSTVRSIRLDDGMTRSMAIDAMRGLLGGR